MTDAFMLEAAHVKGVVGTVGIGVNDAVRLDFAGNNGHQRLGSGVVDHRCVDLSLAFDDAKDSYFTRCPTTSFAFAFAPKIAFIQFDATFKNFAAFLLQMMGNHLSNFLAEKRRRIALDTQHIGGRMGSDFKHKKLKQLPLMDFH